MVTTPLVPKHGGEWGDASASADRVTRRDAPPTALVGTTVPHKRIRPTSASENNRVDPTR
jgi:hypothetical protein